MVPLCGGPFVFFLFSVMVLVIPPRAFPNRNIHLLLFVVVGQQAWRPCSEMSWKFPYGEPETFRNVNAAVNVTQMLSTGI